MNKKYTLWIYPLIVLGLVLILSNGCKNNMGTTARKASYPIDSTVVTTADRTIIPDPVPSASPKILPSEISKFS